MSKEIYTCDACHYIFEAETGCDQCPDCGKKRVRPADCLLYTSDAADDT